MTLEKIFKKCKSFDVVYLQLRVKLHLSWAFLNYRSFLRFYLLNNLCEIVRFERGGLVPLIPSLRAALVPTAPDFYWHSFHWHSLVPTAQFLTFNRLKSQYNSTKCKTFARFRLVKHSFKFTIKTRDRWRHQKRLWHHYFNFRIFWFVTKNLLSFTIGAIIKSFFENFGSDVTVNDVINFKEFF